ncbi:hypothetical protein NDR87_27535 [Nocardia sp. CDC159]|uniref:DUF732 domain-containing protein n=1 Tax=Nocardia pulmonis TaxID=2951408 RepID=A0A9X2EBG3_9NOCA|nr:MULTISPECIES: hypothetical protein [Nocardia]MCM6777246.1 hypothetical protein [Nocardia pulmonis]MCM6790131.1 hypothetical protein [Nocardia sp. CDC159]
MRISLIAAAFVALPLLAACGGSDTKDAQPQITQADVSKSLQSGGLQANLADCAAKHFVDAGISQDGLRTMTKSNTAPTADPGTGMSKQDAEKARSAAQKIATECFNPS